MMMKYRTHDGEVGGYFDLAEIVLWKRGATDPHIMIDKNGDVRKPPKRTKPVRKKRRNLTGIKPITEWPNRTRFQNGCLQLQKTISIHSTNS